MTGHTTQRPAARKRILGIDPGTGRMGYGVAEERGGTYQCIDVGCLMTAPNTPHAVRLVRIQQEVASLIQRHAPTGAVIERLFFSKNVRTALSIAEARGVILATLTAANIPVVELSPQHVKMGVTGYGRASKEQVQTMVQRLFGLAAPPRPDDAADALALAFAGLSHFSLPRP